MSAPVPRVRREGAQEDPHLPQILPEKQEIQGLADGRRHQQPAHASAPDVRRRRADPGPGLRERKSKRQTAPNGTGTHQPALAHRTILVLFLPSLGFIIAVTHGPVQPCVGV